MEKNPIDHLEELYKKDLYSHDIKKNLINIGATSFKFNDLIYKNKLSGKKSKDTLDNNKIFGGNSITYKNKGKKDININSYEQKEQKDNSFSNNSEDIKNEEEKVNEIKLKKKRNLELNIWETIKKGGENINKAQILLINKSSSKQIIKQEHKTSSKNCLSSTKRGNLLQNSKSHKKQKDKDIEKESLFRNENGIKKEFKRKKTFFRPSNFNNKLSSFSKGNNIFYTENENNEYNNEYNDNNYNKNEKKSKFNNEYSQFRNHQKTNLYKNFLNTNDFKKVKKFNTNRIFEYYKIEGKNKNNQNHEIIYDTDSEVENKILSILDKSYKMKRNSVSNTKKHRHYETHEIVNDKYLNNLQNSLQSKKHKSNNIGKISNFNSISIIKNKELNHCNISNEDQDEDSFINVNYKYKFKNISSQKVVSFEYNDKEKKDKNNNDNMNFNSNKNFFKNENKKKYIIYNNINYYKTTDKDNNKPDNEKNQNKEKENKEQTIYNDKSNLNKISLKNCMGLFNCCLLLE